MCWKRWAARASASAPPPPPAFAVLDIQPLNLLAIEVAVAPGAPVIPLTTGLDDKMFAHDGQITRPEMRAMTLAALAPRRGELLWDIGGGAGSIGIEWMLADPANRAIAIERDPVRAARDRRQRGERLGVPALRVVEGAAPAALSGLPAPDAVFIGGGAQQPGMIDSAWSALRPGGRMVANGVVIETEAVLLALRARIGGTLTRLSTERLDRIGGLHGFRPGMTVTQWSAVKP